MSNDSLTDSLLEAFLDDLLPESKMVEIEQRLRAEPELNARLTSIIQNREHGVHSIGEIWRRHRLSCPSREELGSYLLNALMDEQVKFIEFHLQYTSCRYCQSNLDDLRRLQANTPQETASRRQKYFQSSVGRLPK
jgi:hypothetical protein